MLRPGGLWCLPGMALLLSACVGSNSEGAKLYRALHEIADYGDRVEELESYPVEQQYEVFLHGMRRVLPPESTLAIPIAKRGKPAMDYVLDKLAASGEDLDYVDSMRVFTAMVWGGTTWSAPTLRPCRKSRGTGPRSLTRAGGSSTSETCSGLGSFAPTGSDAAATPSEDPS